MGSKKIEFASREILDTETSYLNNLRIITISLEKEIFRRNLSNETDDDMLIERLRCLVTPLGQLLEYHTENGKTF